MTVLKKYKGVAKMDYVHIDDESKLAVLRVKLAEWKNTLYSAQLDHEVGRLTGDEAMMSSAQRMIKRAVAGIDLIEDQIKTVAAPEGHAEQ